MAKRAQWLGTDTRGVARKRGVRRGEDAGGWVWGRVVGGRQPRRVPDTTLQVSPGESVQKRPSCPEGGALPAEEGKEWWRQRARVLALGT